MRSLLRPLQGIAVRLIFILRAGGNRNNSFQQEEDN
jgi:hypothetical protein